MAQSTTIIPVAGGKGGVGKSFLTANLAVALASRGHSTIAVDLDLGNSSLHGFLNLENRHPGVGEYLHKLVDRSLSDLVVRTEVPHLGFLAGDGRMPFMANIAHHQKRRLIRALRQLPARYVVLDLSAGTSFNTLDLFLISDCGIVVTTPEYPAIMKMLVFIKNFVLRALKQRLRGNPALVNNLNEVYQQDTNAPSFTVENFRKHMAETDQAAAAKVTQICQRLRPRVIYNMMESLEETAIFPRIDRSLSDTLSIACDHICLIPYDSEVRRSVKQPGIFALRNSSSPTSHTIDRIAERIVRYWDEPIIGSAELLTNYARSVFGGEANSAVVMQKP
jgi:flagellar biosynthesis protein FlhG